MWYHSPRPTQALRNKNQHIFQGASKKLSKSSFCLFWWFMLIHCSHFFCVQSMEQLKFKLMFPIEYPAYQNGNKLISQDVSDLMETFAFIRKPNFHILSWNPYSWSYLEHADSNALWNDDTGMLLRTGCWLPKFSAEACFFVLLNIISFVLEVRANFQLLCFKSLMNYTSCTCIRYICLLHNYCKIILLYNIIQLQAGNLPHLASSMFLKSSPRQRFSPKVHKRYVNLPKDSPGSVQEPFPERKRNGKSDAFRRRALHM